MYIFADSVGGRNISRAYKFDVIVDAERAGVTRSRTHDRDVTRVANWKAQATWLLWQTFNIFIHTGATPNRLWLGKWDWGRWLLNVSKSLQVKSYNTCRRYKLLELLKSNIFRFNYLKLLGGQCGTMKGCPSNIMARCWYAQSIFI